MQTGNLAADPAAQKEYQLLKVLAEHYFGSMMVTDSKGRFLYANDGCCKLLGIDRETLLNISIYDTLHDYQQAMEACERKYISDVVDACGGNIRQAAEKMGLHISTLYRKIDKLGLSFSKDGADGAGFSPQAPNT